jgi:LuxR family transcriptional regulator, quorum-sensing system regulator CciR
MMLASARVGGDGVLGEDQIAADIERADDLLALWAVFSGYFEGSAVDRVVYLHLPPIGAPDSSRPSLVANGFPSAAVERYMENGRFLDNPMLGETQRRVAPVYWDEIDAGARTDERQAGFLEEFRGFGLGAGVAIPAYGPNGRGGQFGLGFVDGVRRLAPETLRCVQRVCQTAHLRCCALILPGLGPPPNLTRRETEVLLWLARGKNNATVGDILGISPHTVEAHLRRIYVKLGVFDRVSAAVRGIGVGLIHAATH